MDKNKFKDGLVDFWSRLNYDILDLAKRTGSDSNPSMYQYRLISMVNELGNNVQPIYGMNTAYPINTAMGGLFAGLLQAYNLIENNVDTANLTTKIVNGPISDLDATLGQLNVDWRNGVIKNLFIALWESWLNEARAHMIGDSTKVTQSFIEAQNNSDAFTDLFYNSVLKQFPNLFT